MEQGCSDTKAPECACYVCYTDIPHMDAVQTYASACLVSWKRPDNLRAIVRHLRTFSFIDDIVIWNNNPLVELSIDDDRTLVINSSVNLVTYGRYLASYHAKHDVIYTQDDDWIVRNIDGIHAAYRADPERIVHGLHEVHYRINHGNTYGSAQMSLVGWGAFFRRDWLNVFDAYIAEHGQDDVLFREADRLFSLLLDRRHTSLLAELEELPEANGDCALWRQKEHQTLATEAVRRALVMLGRGHLDPVSPVFREG